MRVLHARLLKGSRSSPVPLPVAAAKLSATGCNARVWPTNGAFYAQTRQRSSLQTECVPKRNFLPAKGDNFCRTRDWSLTGEERISGQSVLERHFAPADYCTAKGLFDHLVSGGEQHAQTECPRGSRRLIVSSNLVDRTRTTQLRTAEEGVRRRQLRQIGPVQFLVIKAKFNCRLDDDENTGRCRNRAACKELTAGSLGFLAGRLCSPVR